MRKKCFNKKAFTLVEVIVAFSVLILVIVASTDLLVSVIRSNNENENTIVAYGLAQEGLEAVRNMRDSDWLLGADFQGNIGSSGCPWTACFPDIAAQPQDFVLDFNLNNQNGNITDASSLPTVAPWVLKPVDLTDPTSTSKDWSANSSNWMKTKLYFQSTDPSDSSGNSGFWYKPCDQGCTEQPSLFSRYVEIQAVQSNTASVSNASPSAKVQKYLVASVVKWQELGRNKEVRLTTELTNWKGGPL